MLTEVSQSQKEKYCIIYNLFIILHIILILYAMIYYLLLLYEILRIVKLVRTESIMVVAEDWGRRKWKVNGHRVSAFQDEKSNGTCGGDGSKTL